MNRDNTSNNGGQPQNDNKAYRNNPGANPPGTGPGNYEGNNRAANGQGNAQNDQKSYANNPGANPPGTGKS